jgi:5'-nucleotidase / UDP-sugar diphosphatase
VKPVIAGLLLLTAACLASVPPPIPLKPVRFLLINDVATADSASLQTGDLARAATVRRRLTDQGPVLFVLAGDALGNSPSGQDSAGREMVEVLNRAQLNYATFGRQELSLMLDTLLARVAQSKFIWLSSNCTLANGRPLAGVQAWDTVRLWDHKIGLFGLTLQGSYPHSVRCANTDSAAHRTIEVLSAEGAELIVGLTHQPMSADRDLLGREPKLDLVLGGYEHRAQDSVVSGRHAVKADSNVKSAQFVTVWGGKGNWRQAVGLVRINTGIPMDTTVVTRTGKTGKS